MQSKGNGFTRLEEEDPLDARSPTRPVYTPPYTPVSTTAPDDQEVFKEEGEEEFRNNQAALLELEGDSRIPRNVRAVLYTSHTLCTWCERMWEFSVILFLTEISPGVGLVSTYGLLVCLTVSCFGSVVGRWLDSTPRLRALRTVSILRNASIATCALTSAWLMGSTGLGAAPQSPLLHTSLVAMILILGAVAGLGSRAQVIALEQDWVVVLARGDLAWLLHTNTTMRRIDLTCDMLAPAAVGVIVTITSVETAALAVAVSNLVSVVVEYMAMSWMHTKEENLAVKPTAPMSTDFTSINSSGDTKSIADSIAASSNYFTDFSASAQIYFKHKTAPPAIALALLYFTVLSFGNVMIAYLRLKAVPDSVVSGARSACALLGFIGTLIYPIIVKHYSLQVAGLVSIWGQASFLVVGAGFSAGSSVGVYVLICGVVLSRAALWMFDLSVSQIIQEHVGESERGTFNGMQQSLQGTLEMASYATALILHKPEQFWILVLLSCISTSGAACIYTTYFVRSA